MNKLIAALVAAIFGAMLVPAPAGATPGATEPRLTKTAYALWSTTDVNVYLPPEVKAAHWGIGAAMRAWSTGPVRLHAVSDASRAQITFTTIPNSPHFLGSSEYTHVGGVMQSCVVTLSNHTRDQKRKHVAAHELGHCLGLPHVSTSRSIMDWWLRGDYSKPTAVDLDWLRRSYSN